jgi:hypothetical protein
MDLSGVRARKIIQNECNRKRAWGLCIYSGNSRYCAASCGRKLKAAPGEVEINRLKEDLGKEKDKKEELEKV